MTDGDNLCAVHEVFLTQRCRMCDEAKVAKAQRERDEAREAHESLHSTYRGLYALWLRVARAMTPAGGLDITDEEVATRCERLATERDALAARATAANDSMERCERGLYLRINELEERAEKAEASLVSATEAAHAERDQHWRRRVENLEYWLRIYIHAHETGNSVSVFIDRDARRALAKPEDK